MVEASRRFSILIIKLYVVNIVTGKNVSRLLFRLLRENLRQGIAVTQAELQVSFPVSVFIRAVMDDILLRMPYAHQTYTAAFKQLRKLRDRITVLIIDPASVIIVTIEAVTRSLRRKRESWKLLSKDKLSVAAAFSILIACIMKIILLLYPFLFKAVAALRKLGGPDTYRPQAAVINLYPLQAVTVKGIPRSFLRKYGRDLRWRRVEGHGCLHRCSVISLIAEGIALRLPSRLQSIVFDINGSAHGRVTFTIVIHDISRIKPSEIISRP